jgi:catechol 2,3-dioxygenase-like lactoylglutathione lyase family enzyme
MSFKYHSAVIFVDDMQAARRFYEGILGQVVQTDHGGYVTYAGFALWSSEKAGEAIFERRIPRGERGSGDMELYFETDDIDGSYESVLASGAGIIHAVRQEPWGQKTFRCYDPEGHIVEVGEPMRQVVQRMAAAGYPLEKVAEQTTLPMELILQIIEYPRFC